MRAIGSGFQSVLFADVRTVADAVACVRRCARIANDRRLLGVGMRRDVGGVGEVGTPPTSRHLTIVVAIMSRSGVREDLDAILHEGIDMVQFGPGLCHECRARWPVEHPDVSKPSGSPSRLRSRRYPSARRDRVTCTGCALSRDGVKHFLWAGMSPSCMMWRAHGEQMRKDLAAMVTDRESVASLLSRVSRGGMTVESGMTVIA